MYDTHDDGSVLSDSPFGTSPMEIRLLCAEFGTSSFLQCSLQIVRALVFITIVSITGLPYLDFGWFFKSQDTRFPSFALSRVVA